MILLDTDIVSHVFKANPKVLERLRGAMDPVAITIITRLEILRGRSEALLKAADGLELQEAMSRLTLAEQALGRFLVVPVDAASAAEFDRLRRNRKAKKVGRADLLIASIALAHKATLVTRNVRDFAHVPHLRIENWAD